MIVSARAEARINTWIAATGSFFQSYLRRALSNLAGEETERAGLRSAPSSPQGLRPSSYVSPTDLSSLPDASHERLSNRASDADYPSPARNGSRVSSGAGMANDEKLDSLKEMFGVSRLSVAKP